MKTEKTLHQDSFWKRGWSQLEIIYYRYYTQWGGVTLILPISDVSASQWMKHLFCLVSQADSIPTRKGVSLMTSNGGLGITLRFGSTAVSNSSKTIVKILFVRLKSR